MAITKVTSDLLNSTALTSKAFGTSSIMIGDDATGTIDAANYNTGLGVDVFAALTTGDSNLAVGYQAGTAITTGDKNTFVGSSCGAGTTTANFNTGVGMLALTSNSTGANNTGVGLQALANNSTASNNTAMGFQALLSNTTGAGNTGVGQSSMLDCTTGSENTAIGNYSGENITTGGNNTVLGRSAGASIQSGSNNIAVGYGADCAHDSANSITLGVGISGQGNNFKFGKASNIVSNVFTTNASWARSSDVHKKTNIEDDTLGLDFINDLRTVKFNWRPNSEFPKHYDDYSETENHMDTETRLHGMIAQEVKEALNKQGVDTFGGWSEDKDGSQRISQEMFVHPLIKAVQELSAEVQELKKQLENK